ncbi:MAG TPA: hypothetical protein DIC36_08035 [Gammaproteobacteria bacterium]|nr:hypothetical protein [Gammaproteobacteria bacterium]
MTLVPFQRFYAQMSAWKQDPNSFVMNFEDAPNPGVLHGLLDYLGGEEAGHGVNPVALEDWRQGLDEMSIERIEKYKVTGRTYSS